MSAAAVRDFLGRHGLAPSRRRGQNFLVDESLAARLVTLSGVGSGDAVIEVGTGLGVLTRALAARARRVLTLEVDAGLVRALRADASLPPGVDLRHADVLECDLRALAGELGAPARLVGNLPYAISSPLLRRLLDLRDVLEGWAVLLQRELAQRLVAGPGERDYGSLAVLHQLTVSCRAVQELRPGCFFPVPQVMSRFVVVEPAPADGGPAPDGGELARIERVARAAFGTRRKTLANALRTGLGLEAARVEAALVEAGLPPGVRAEAVPPGVFRALAGRLGTEA